jgi:hypothetical protein
MCIPSESRQAFRVPVLCVPRVWPAECTCHLALSSSALVYMRADTDVLRLRKDAHCVERNQSGYMHNKFTMLSINSRSSTCVAYYMTRLLQCHKSYVLDRGGSVADSCNSSCWLSLAPCSSVAVYINKSPWFYR